MPAAFGTMPSGDTVYRHEIAAGGLSAAILTYGAVIQEIRLAGFDRSLVLGLNSLEDYVEYSPCFGAIVGRVANRIGFGRFKLDGTAYQIERNINKTHTLHSASAGLHLKNWQIVDSAADFIMLEAVTNDGEAGFPGTMTIRCTYRVIEPAGLQITLGATTDAACPCNLAPHSYFNLEGQGDILGHELMIDAQDITPMNDHLIPTGEVLSVENTTFDFRTARTISTGRADGSMRYDHNYCLADKPRSLRQVAFVRAPKSGMEMAVLTTQPGVQFYDGAKISIPVTGIDGWHYSANAGLCLESQHWPDAPNHEGFPDITLRPGEMYEHQSEYHFNKR